MPLAARLSPGETLGDRVLRVDHAGEHGAVCVYRAQRRLARWTAPDLLAGTCGADRGPGRVVPDSTRLARTA